MKSKYIGIVMAITFITSQPTSAEEADFYAQKDKQQHITVSSLMASLTTGYARTRGYSKVEFFFIGLGTATAIELIKEGVDATGSGDSELGDMKVNVLGATKGALISAQFEWKF